MNIGPFEWGFFGSLIEEVEEEKRLNKNDTLHKEDEYMYDGISIYDPSIDETDLSKQQEFISLKEVNNLVSKKRKLPLRPFEKYIQDLIAGKKTLDDGLD